MADLFSRTFPHRACGYAAMRGTILMVEDWFLNTALATQAARANRRSIGHRRDVRERVAGGGRHIAPALLLC